MILGLRVSLVLQFVFFAHGGILFWKRLIQISQPGYFRDSSKTGGNIVLSPDLEVAESNRLWLVCQIAAVTDRDRTTASPGRWV